MLSGSFELLIIGLMCFFAPGPLELLIVGLVCLAFFVVPVVVIVVLMSGRHRSQPPPDRDQRIRCPQCGESIAAIAIKCRFCGAQLNPPASGMGD